MTAAVRRIGIDIRYLSHGLLGGVHTYVRNLVPALLRAARDLEFVLYADLKAPLDWEPPAGATLRLLPWRSEVSSLVNDVTLARQMAADRIDVAHHPANYGFAPRGGCSVVTIHDALNLQPVREGLRGFGNAPGIRTTVMVCYLSMMSRAAARKATWLITISDHARREITAAAPGLDARITVVPEGPPFSADDLPDAAMCANALRTLKLMPGFVLADAIKNPGVLIEGWRRLTPELRQAHPLVFFSRRMALLPVLETAVRQGEARVVFRPETTLLRAMYRSAGVFAFPSWIEGFGLPLLEAMTAGVPIIASDRGSIPEVAGDAAVLCDAEDAAGFARGLTRLLNDDDERARLIARGTARVAGFTWERTARETLDVYRHAYAQYSQRHGARQ